MFRTYFSQNPAPGCPNNGLPVAGTFGPTFIPCTAAFQGFVGGDPNQGGNFGCASGSPGAIPTTNLFVLAVPRKFVTPSTQQWNLTIQRDLGKQWVLEVGYVGTHATHLRETRTDLTGNCESGKSRYHNGYERGTHQITANTFNNAPLRSPIPSINGYGGFQIFANDAYSHYNSLQTTLSRRWGNGYFQAAYTWSKSTDATSSGNTALNTAYNNEADLKNSRGLSDFDRPQRLAVSYCTTCRSSQIPPGSSHRAGRMDDQRNYHRAIRNAIFRKRSQAGSAFISPGYTPTLTASLAPGATIGSGYTRGYSPTPERLPKSGEFSPRLVALSDAVRNGSQLLHNEFRKSWAQHVSRTLPAELGFLSDQKFPHNGTRGLGSRQTSSTSGTTPILQILP